MSCIGRSLRLRLTSTAKRQIGNPLIHTALREAYRRPAHISPTSLIFRSSASPLTTSIPAPMQYPNTSLANDKLLVYVPQPAPQAWLAKVKAQFPGLEIAWVQTPVVDGRLLPPDDVSAEDWEGVTMVCMYHVPKIECVPNVRFFQLASAGSDFWHKYPKYLDPTVVFSNASGCQP